MKFSGLKIGDITARLPIIQGGMGVGISRSKLAGAVAAAGGIGVISTVGVGYDDPNYYDNSLEANLKALVREIKAAREMAPNGVLGINILVAVQNYKEYVKAAVEAEIDLVISGAGLPMDLPKLVEGTKTKIAPIVSSGKAAKVICKSYLRKANRLPDLLVVEGSRAGGHLGFKREDLESGNVRDLEVIVQEVIETVKEFEEKENVKIPVVAAGGIYDGNDIGKFLSLGAAGVQMGTRFIGTYECDAHEDYKQAYIDAKEEDIVLVQSPVGLPGRAIRNEHVKKVENGKVKITYCDRCLVPCNPAEAPYCISQALISAVEGDTVNGLLFTGDNGYRINELVHVDDLMKQLVDELENY